MSRRYLYFFAVPFVLLASVAAFNYIGVQRPLSEVLKADERNKGIDARAHYQYYVVPSKLVFDLRDISETNSAADVTRALLQFAATQKEKSYAEVALAYRGTPKFKLQGTYFHTLGAEYGTQNPVYTMRTFAENVYQLDGTAAFGTWTGGILGVMSKQMEDFNDFHKQWYITDLSKIGDIE